MMYVLEKNMGFSSVTFISNKLMSLLFLMTSNVFCVKVSYKCTMHMKHSPSDHHRRHILQNHPTISI